MAEIGLINYGAGNYMSVFNALKYLDLDILEVKKPAMLDETTHIILPGVGSFNALIDKLEAKQFIDSLRKHVLGLAKPFLGICVGMQVLATLGTEFHECQGLGYISGNVVKIPVEQYSMRLPHIGWNEVIQEKDSLLFKDIENFASFYFVHSYHFVPVNKSCITATCTYGGNVVASVEQDNCFGVQFHPEKSQDNGLKLLKNFSEIKNNYAKN